MSFSFFCLLRFSTSLLSESKSPLIKKDVAVVCRLFKPSKKKKTKQRKLIEIIWDYRAGGESSEFVLFVWLIELLRYAQSTVRTVFYNLFRF